MTHDTVLERLDEWLGGDLPAAERAEVDLHLAGCEACRAEADALRALLDEVGALPTEILPEHDLWAGIRARMEPRGAETAPAGASRRGLRMPRWGMQAAAAIMLTVGSSAITYRMMNREAPPTGKDPVTDTRRSKPAVSALVAFQPAEQDYQSAITELEGVLRAKRDRLSPETVQTLETNLRIIDEAIRQSRAALARDPNSAEVAHMLSQAYDQKLNVLQQAVAL
jgi:anti-sigma factor RsiW